MDLFHEVNLQRNVGGKEQRQGTKKRMKNTNSENEKIRKIRGTEVRKSDSKVRT
jgi:hypothetical protein